MAQPIRTFDDLTPFLQNASSAAIAGHIRPDGDAIGSCTALYLYVKKAFPELPVRLYLEEFPHLFDFLPGVGDALHTYDGTKPDLLILSDVSSVERIGVSGQLYEDARFIISIDHHISNPGIGHENCIVPDASSTAEVVYHLLRRELLDTEIAKLLYLGIAHDTGVFQYQNTSPEVHRIAADLLTYPIGAPELIDRTINTRTYKETRIVGYALANASLFARGRAVISCLTPEETESFGVTPLELSSIVSELRKTENVEAAVFIYPVGDGYKASLRSRDTLDVSAIAVKYGGGGHKRAAGCSFDCPIEEAAEIMINEITKALFGGE